MFNIQFFASPFFKYVETLFFTLFIIWFVYSTYGAGMAGFMHAFFILGILAFVLLNVGVNQTPLLFNVEENAFGFVKALVAVFSVAPIAVAITLLMLDAAQIPLLIKHEYTQHFKVLKMLAGLTVLHFGLRFMFSLACKWKAQKAIL